MDKNIACLINQVNGRIFLSFSKEVKKKKETRCSKNCRGERYYIFPFGFDSRIGFHV